MGRHWKYFFLLLWFSYLLVSGVLLFARGFLLSRISLPYNATCIATDMCSIVDTHSYDLNTTKLTSQCLNDDQFSATDSEVRCAPSRAKVILIVIDALRYDFVLYDESAQDSQRFAYQNKLTVVNDLLINKPNNSKLYKFVADPPTTTMQRLKGITTGSLPTFIDVGSNFATPEINEDNIIDQLQKYNRNVVFMGDDTWVGLYPSRFVREFSYPSFNVWDLDTVDNGIKDHLIPEIKKSDWQLFVAHFLGVDHCGHRYGPYHSEMSRKLKEMNNVIRDVIDSMDESTMLFVIGDHGMTSTGDHGGDTEAEVSAAMFVYSPKPLIPLDYMSHSNVVNQVDLVPTLASILGIPIPFSNLGSVILDSLPSSSEKNDWKYALHSLWNNVEQTTNYIRQYSQNNNQFSNDKLVHLYKTYNKLQDQVQSVTDKFKFKNFAFRAKEYLTSLKHMCEEVWVEFDPMAISRGLLLTFLTIFLSFLIVDGLPSDVLNSSFLIVGYSSVVIAAVVCIVCYIVELIQNLEQNLYFVTGIASLFCMSLVVIQNWAPIVSNWYIQTKSKDWTNISSRLLVVLSLFGMFSNSYIVEEAYTLSYFLLTLTWLLVYNLKTRTEGISKSRCNDKSSSGWSKTLLTPMKVKVLLIAVFFSVLIRTSRYYWRCREEQVDCESFVTHKPHSSGTLIEGKYRNAECLFTLVCLALFVTVARIWLRSCGNLVGFSPTVTLARYSPTVIVVCTGGFWILHGLPRDLKSKFFLPWQLQFLPLVIYGIMLVVFISLFAQPLCIYTLPKVKENLASVYGQENAIPQLFHQIKEMIAKHNNLSKRGSGDEAQAEDKFPVIYGLATVYSAAFVILGVFLCLLVALLLGDVLAPASVLMMSACVALLALLSLLQYEKSLLTGICLHAGCYSSL
ncbi:GPI ethanolamine phosphate transferase 3 isoform X2 [Anabrus simplex]|uniref:GPI ethanolamine phosphate transferase 3 isoform X2 n=1 Tax=Anabrus simplex TaxID=316456 RepID=UPI0035A2E158